MRPLTVLLASGAVAVAASAAGAATLAAAAAAKPVTHTVTIENMQFNPPALTVKSGERVVWVNKDLFPHTVTADNKSFDSGSIAANASWSYVAREKGEYAYSCTFHPTMHGKLTVQ
jgi:plastocyanin